ncbi:hypothetical protein AX17_004440 [Amanita inopinata Kibby_2008]|nr:hypothetical protein AX17_004440 [Amanita inopinata Kibby_2008]
MAPRILICAELVWAHEDLQRLLRDISEIVYMDSPDRASFLEACRPGGKYDGIVGIYRENESARKIGVFDKEVINGLPSSVKWIAHNGAGYDPVDVYACKARGIYLSNTPGAVDEATATTALYLMISTMRQFSLAERSLRQQKWKPAGVEAHTHDLTDKTLAILGLGGIGRRLAELAHGFPMRIIYHSRRRVEDAPDYCEYFANVEEMLRQADVLSVHVPLRKETEGIVGERWIRTLKPGAIIINTARGKVIDEEAMIRALQDGHLASVGLDVYPNEPQVNPRLLEFSQVTLLPHMGTQNQDSQRRMEVRALTNLRDFLTSGMGKDLVIEFKEKEAKVKRCYEIIPRYQTNRVIVQGLVVILAVNSIWCPAIVHNRFTSPHVNLPSDTRLPSFQSYPLFTMSPNDQSNKRDNEQLKSLDSFIKAYSTIAASHAALGAQDGLKIHGEKELTKELDELKKKLAKHDEEQKKHIEDFKKKIREDITPRLQAEVKIIMKEQVATEVAQQVKAEVDEQMREHLPITLDKQIQDSKEHLARLRTALANSEARLKNSGQKVEDWTEPLAVVLKEDGTKSSFFPVDSEALWFYKPKDLKRLLVDYNLEYDEASMGSNFERFVKFIGVRVHGEIHRLLPNNAA